MRLLLAATILTVLTTLAGCGGSADRPAASLPGFFVEIDALQAKYALPALAGAIVRNDAIQVCARGVRKLGSPGLVTVDDRFHVGSCTKAMTATLIGMLVDQGMLRWAMTPAEVLPELAATIDPGYAGITLEQLLAHRAGLPAYEDVAAIQAAPQFAGSPVQQRRAFLAWQLAQPPAVPPGTFLYSNAGCGIVAAMVEQVCGEAWESLMTRRLFRPLGIAATYGWPALTDPNQPWGHLWLDDALMPHDPNTPGEQLPAWAAPAGDASMSVEGLARFARAHLQGLQGHSGLVSAAMMTRLHAPVGDAISPGGYYSCGWVEQDTDGGRLSWHDGSGGTFFAFVALDPSVNLAVVGLTNGCPPAIDNDEVFVELLQWAQGIVRGTAVDLASKRPTVGSARVRARTRGVRPWAPASSPRR